MERLKLIYNFVKENIDGKNSYAFLVASLAVLLFKMLGIFGLAFGLVFVVCVDVYKTANVPYIFSIFKDKFIKLK